MENKDLSQKVMGEIHQKEIKMKPRLYFVAGSLILGVGLLTAAGLVVFFFNLISFHLRTGCCFGFLEFGKSGILPFLANLPWLAMIVAIGGIIGGFFIIRQYDISYKFNLAILLTGILIPTIACGVIMDQTGINERLETKPALRSLYRQRFENSSWIIGTIKEVDRRNNKTVIELPNGKEVRVSFDKKTSFPSGTDFRINQPIRVIGQPQNEVFHADGIMPIFQRKLFKK